MKESEKRKKSLKAMLMKAAQVEINGAAESWEKMVTRALSNPLIEGENEKLV